LLGIMPMHMMIINRPCQASSRHCCPLEKLNDDCKYTTHRAVGWQQNGKPHCPRTLRSRSRLMLFSPNSLQKYLRNAVISKQCTVGRSEKHKHSYCAYTLTLKYWNNLIRITPMCIHKR